MTHDLEAENARLREALGEMRECLRKARLKLPCDTNNFLLSRIDAALSPPSACEQSAPRILCAKPNILCTHCGRAPGQRCPLLVPPSSSEQSDERGTFDEPRLAALTASATEEAKRDTYTWLSPSVVLELIRNLRAARFERDAALSPPSASEQSADVA